MPTRTGKLSFTETAGGVTCSLRVLLEPHPPFIEDSFIYTVPDWAKDAIRAGVGNTATISSTGGTPDTIVAVSVR